VSSTSFLSDVWVSQDTLDESFPRLFQILVQQLASVGSLVSLINRLLVWDLRWRQSLFAWEYNEKVGAVGSSRGTSDL